MRPDGGRTRDDGDEDLLADLAGELKGTLGRETPSTAEPADPHSADAGEDLGRLPTMSPGAARRGRKKAGTKRRPPVAALILGALILAGAAFLFWPASPPPPVAGIGDQRSIVTSEQGRAGFSEPEAPVSGNVDLTREIAPLVPEAAGGAAPRAPATPERRSAAGAAVAASAPTTTIPSAARPAPATGPAQQRSSESPADGPTEPRPAAALQPGVTTPGPTGNWAVQLGAFSSQGNADVLVTRLRSKGLEPRVVTGNAAGGNLVYKVWVGYFTSREHAAAYAARQAGDLGVTGLAVHR